MTREALEISSPVGLIAGGGVMPFAVADSLVARGIDPVLFALQRRLRSRTGGSASVITGYRSVRSAGR